MCCERVFCNSPSTVDSWVLRALMMSSLRCLWCSLSWVTLWRWSWYIFSLKLNKAHLNNLSTYKCLIKDPLRENAELCFQFSYCCCKSSFSLSKSTIRASFSWMSWVTWAFRCSSLVWTFAIAVFLLSNSSFNKSTSCSWVSLSCLLRVWASSSLKHEKDQNFHLVHNVHYSALLC